MKYTHDVFIAYHGTYSTAGSYEAAQTIEQALIKEGLRPYLFRESTGESWTEALGYIQTSRTMLVVVNSTVLRDENGKISRTRSSGEPYQLRDEIEHFRTFVNRGLKNLQTINFIYSGNDKGFDEARLFLEALVPEICPKLNRILAIVKDNSTIINWINGLPSGEDVEDIIKEIVDNLLKRNCAVVLGPLVNDNYKNFLGRPEISFFSKAQKYYGTHGEQLLGREIGKFAQNGYSIPVRHLAKLPFSSYITTVEHTKICEALNDSEKECVLIEDPEAIYGLDLQKGEIPVFELKRSKPFVDDCILPEGLNRAVLKMILTGRKILYVGFGRQYTGYLAVSKVLKELLGSDYTLANNIVVSFEPDSEQSGVYQDKNGNFRRLNLTMDDFIGRLISNRMFSKSFRYDGEESKFISDLFNIASTPTETQAIELFLEQVSEDLERNRNNIQEVIHRADLNCNHLKQIKRNFNAFVKSWNSIKEEVGENPSYWDLKDAIENYQAKRRSITSNIRKQGYAYSMVAGRKRILLFSESLRVVEFLTGATKSFQENSELFICECRPKSETPFQDAKNMYNLLKEKGAEYGKVIVIPDMAAFNLIERNLIDVVILGAHDVLFYEGKPINFINTCGSSALIEIAYRQGIEIIVVAETGKFNYLVPKEHSNPGDFYEYEISYGHESTIYEDYDFMIWAENEIVDTKNIGYDFCAFHKGMKLIYEAGDPIEADECALRIHLVDKTKE